MTAMTSITYNFIFLYTNCETYLRRKVKAKVTRLHAWCLLRNKYGTLKDNHAVHLKNKLYLSSTCTFCCEKKESKLSNTCWVQLFFTQFASFPFRWLRDTFRIGVHRELEEHEIYDVTNGMRSDRITGDFVKLWDEELMKPSPSLLRVMHKLHGFSVWFWCILYASCDSLARWA